MEENLDMYCTVEELRQRISALEPEVPLAEKTTLKLREKPDYADPKLNSTLNFNFIEGKRDVLQVGATAQKKYSEIESSVRLLYLIVA